MIKHKEICLEHKDERNFNLFASKHCPNVTVFAKRDHLGANLDFEF